MRVWTKHESGPPRRVAPVAGRENAMISKLTVPVFRAWSRGRGPAGGPEAQVDSPVGRQPPDDLVRAVGESKSPGDDPTGGVSPPVGSAPDQMILLPDVPTLEQWATGADVKAWRTISGNSLAVPEGAFEEFGWGCGPGFPPLTTQIPGSCC